MKGKISSNCDLKYSAFEHLRRALFRGDNDLIAMLALTLYCDASGKEDSTIMSVGGFVGEVDAWNHFNIEWNAVLAEFGLKYFRMSEFAHSVGQFAHGWKGHEKKRRTFLQRLLSIILAHTKFWVGVCLLLSDYQRVDKDWQLHEWAHPYPLCAKGAVDAAMKWYNAHDYKCPIEYVFEEGDDHPGQLVELVRKETGKSLNFRKKLEASPLQAADFAAYETMKAYRRLSGEMDLLFEGFRKSFLSIGTMPVIFGQFEEKDLRVLCRLYDVPRRAET